MVVTLNFTDGIKINTDGPYRATSQSDGLYVVGGGMCVPVDGTDEAEKLLEELKSK